MREFEEALSRRDDEFYELVLFVIGATSLSARAIANVSRICDEYLSGRHHLTVIDLFDDPDAVERAGVLATPTLVRNRPLPVRRLVGDLSATERVLVVLEITATPVADPGR